MGLGLERRLGPLDGAAIVVSNVIGSGIFLVPAIVAAAVPHPGWMLLLWVLGGALAFAGAMAYAELAALRPRAGGEYVYLREAFGPAIAFLTGWTSFVAGFSGAIAVSAVGLAGYLGRFLPAAADTTPLATVALGPLMVGLSPQRIVALSTIAGLTAVHVIGLGPGRVVQNLLAGIKVSLLVIFVALGFTLGREAGVQPEVVVGSVAVSSWLLALLPVMFAYSGWNAAAYLAEEMRDPGRNVPLALGLGTVVVIAIYILLNLLFLHAMSIGDMAAALGGYVSDVAAERLFGPAVAVPIAAAFVVMIAASISAMVFAGPRVYFAMAQDGQFPAAAGVVHKRFRTPATAIVAQSLWACVLVLTGTFHQLVNYTAFAVVLFSGVAVGALFVLRWRDPSEHRPFRAWGYPLAPFVFLVATLAMVMNSIWREPVPSTAGLALIAAGMPVYYLFVRPRED